MFKLIDFAKKILMATKFKASRHSIKSLNATSKRNSFFGRQEESSKSFSSQCFSDLNVKDPTKRHDSFSIKQNGDFDLEQIRKEIIQRGASQMQREREFDQILDSNSVQSTEPQSNPTEEGTENNTQNQRSENHLGLWEWLCCSKWLCLS